MGVVYILTNEAMPNKVKIGSTGNLEQRIKSLDNTSIPIPFECFFAIEVPNAEEVERKLHKIFAKDRIRSNREFFDILPESAQEALELTNGKDVTPGNMIVDSEEDKVALQCCHLYHSECVKTLVKKRTRKCPICRTRITWNLEQINKHIKLSKEKFNK